MEEKKESLWEAHDRIRVALEESFRLSREQSEKMAANIFNKDDDHVY